MFTATVTNYMGDVLFKETHTNYLFAEESLTQFVESKGWGIARRDPIGCFQVYKDGDSPAMATITW